jgi:hypothetical protein
MMRDLRSPRDPHHGISALPGPAPHLRVNQTHFT